MKGIRIEKKYSVLLSMVLVGGILSIIFVLIFKALFEISTWQCIRWVLEAFG